MVFDPTQPQVGVELVFNEADNTWNLVSTGEALAPPLIHAEIRAHATLSATLLNDVTVNMYAGELAIDAWQNAVFAELKDGHIANAMFANGGAELSEAAIARVEQTIAKEAGFLADFAEGVSNGTVSELQARARATQYAKAMEQSYWNEWQDGIATGDEFAHLPILDQSPGDGGTQCLGHCQCILEFTDSGINWLQFPADHCPDCDALAVGGPYRTT